VQTDVIVIGSGHAGCEAALATARLGLKTLIITINLDSIAMMPCNPNIGGTSKGHLVREIDALGGEMGKNIDKTFIQIKMLNKSKGAAIQSLRAQADKYKYSLEMKKVIENTNNLKFKQGEVKDLLIKNKKICGVILCNNIVINSETVIICTGTYLDSCCLVGEYITNSGPNGLKKSDLLGESLRKLNIKTRRFKTGTSARIDKRSIDYYKIKKQDEDKDILNFSFENQNLNLSRKQISCYLTYTNEKTHKIIKKNIDKSPIYSGLIKSIGARYCPSIEDKVVRFPDKSQHQVFIEPESEDSNEVYVSGMSTSLPEEIQIKFYRTVLGLENCEFTRAGYAIEYDCIDSTQLKLNLEFKNISGLFSAGQINGTSGYEEAAAQGIIAGINAFCYIKNKDNFIISRNEGYIGVLIDDLVTKGIDEPYRMLTSRAEYRLLLRQDNADLRLTERGYKIGLISKKRYRDFLNKKNTIEREILRVKKFLVKDLNLANEILIKNNSNILSHEIFLSDLIKRPELNYDKIKKLDLDRKNNQRVVDDQININIKYEGYIKKQLEQIDKIKNLEDKKIPIDLDYLKIYGLRIEAAQKLNKIRPENIGQALRINGVSHSDISVLIIYMRKNKN
jgi:tRNA uridine 5-carboxymethylaminomethyl modification enzyme